MVERFDDSDQGHGQGHDWEDGAQIPQDGMVYRGQADHDQHASTFNAMQRIGVSVGELWLYYLGMGGNVDEYEIDAYLHGLVRLPALDRDMISQSVNEMIDDICRGPRAPYSANKNQGALDADIKAVIGVHGGGRSRAVVGDSSSGVEARAKTAPEEQVLSVVYSSAATQSFSNADLAELLTLSRSTNHSSHLTGLLLYREGRFLQVLEGPEATVRDRMAIIRADRRHTRLRILVEESHDQRQFPDWTMGYEPISTTMSDQVPGYEKTFTDAEDDADPARTVLVLREFIRWFQDRAVPLR